MPDQKVTLAGLFVVVLLMGSLGAAAVERDEATEPESATGTAPDPEVAAAENTTTQVSSSNDSLAVPVAADGLVGIFAWAVDATIQYPGSVSRPAVFAGLAVGDEVPAASPFFFADTDTAVQVRQGTTTYGITSDPAIGGVRVLMTATFSVVVDDTDEIWFLFSAPGASTVDVTVTLWSTAPGASFAPGLVTADTGRVLLPQDMATTGHARTAAFGSETHAGVGLSTTLTTPDDHRRFVDWSFAHTSGTYSYRAETTTETWREASLGTRLTHTRPHGEIGHDFAAFATTDDVTLSFPRMATATLPEKQYDGWHAPYYADTYPVLTFSLPL